MVPTSVIWSERPTLELIGTDTAYRLFGGAYENSVKSPKLQGGESMEKHRNKA